MRKAEYRCTCLVYLSYLKILQLASTYKKSNGIFRVTTQSQKESTKYTKSTKNSGTFHFSVDSLYPNICPHR